MKLLDFNLEQDADSITASVRVVFEESDQPDKVVYIKTLAEFADGFGANPDAFLVGCLLPALRLGERRIFIDGEICPFLKEGVNTAMHIFSHWTGGKLSPVPVEAGVRQSETGIQAPRTGMVMSGGMDSLCALRLNRLHYPEAHPAYIRDAFFLHGFDIGGVKKYGMKYHVFDRGIRAISKITDDAGATLVPVYTNIRHLCDERELWLNYFFGAVLGAMAHAFAGRIDLMYIASSYDIPNLHACGSHPLLDPEYASWGLRIRHRDYELARLEKIKIVSQWDAAFQNFRVCLANVPDRLNCGVCEKCVRTMTELTALGLLDKTRAFEQNEVLPEDISRYDITIRERPPFYRPLIPLLREKGRDDLAKAIEAGLAKAVG